MTLRTVIDYEADPKNTIVQFVGHRFCCETLDQKLNLRKADSTKLGFQAGDVVYFSENLTPRNLSTQFSCSIDGTKESIL